jgi:hypothetical protein
MTRPDLPRLYQQSREVNQPPVILLHGIMGSRLEDAATGEEVWFGSISRLVFSDYREVALEIDPVSLEPGDGIVTKASLLACESLDSSVTRHRYIDFPLDYPLFLCEKHDALTGNETFQDNLLHALLSLEPSR